MSKHTAGLDLQALMNMPHGAAARTIREKVDPAWGRYQSEGTKTYNVKLSVHESVSVEYTFTVEASSEEEAEELAVKAYADLGNMVGTRREFFLDTDIEDVEVVG
jgi:hypothetical protein